MRQALQIGKLNHSMVVSTQITIYHLALECQTVIMQQQGVVVGMQVRPSLSSIPNFPLKPPGLRPRATTDKHQVDPPSEDRLESHHHFHHILPLLRHLLPL